MPSVPKRDPTIDPGAACAAASRGAPEPDPCSKCGASSARRLGRDRYCSTHLDELYATFTPRPFAGVGLQRGLLQPDWGPLHAELVCSTCGASWVAPIGSPCPWCRRAHELLLEHQRQLTLEIPEVEPDDVTAVARVEAWVQRVRRAVAAELLTVVEADRAIERARRRCA